MAAEFKQLESHSHIDILMATYNGEEYICEQIDSILSQTIDNFRLIIQDDCSTDNTVDIIRKYSEQDSRITLLQNKANLGYVKNFEKLIAISNSDVIFLSDQDDVWHLNKLDVHLKKLNSSDNTCLVYSDLKVVDNDLNTVADSLWQMLGLQPIKGKIDNYNNKNILTGCSCCFKSELKHHFLPFADKIPHDEQIFKQALLHGVDYIETPLVSYRQHENNVIGADKAKLYFVYNTGFFNKKRISKIIPILTSGKNYKFEVTLPEDIKSFYIKPLNKSNKILSRFMCLLNGVNLDFYKSKNIKLLANNTLKIISSSGKLLYNKRANKGSVIEVNYTLEDDFC